MTARRQLPDVFLAHDPADALLATAVADKIAGRGLAVYQPFPTPASVPRAMSSAVRTALQQSFCHAALVTAGYLTSPYLPFFLGAADITGTPVFLLLAGTTSAALPSYLHGRPIEPLWDGLPHAVSRMAELALPLPEQAANHLLAAFAELGIPSERLMASTVDRERLAERYFVLSGTRVSEFRLIRELLRLRKAKKPAARKRTLAK